MGEERDGRHNHDKDATRCLRRTVTLRDHHQVNWQQRTLANEARAKTSLTFDQTITPKVHLQTDKGSKGIRVISQRVRTCSIGRLRAFLPSAQETRSVVSLLYNDRELPLLEP